MARESCRDGFDFGFPDFHPTEHTPPEDMWRNPDFVWPYLGIDVLICNECFKRLKRFIIEANHKRHRELHAKSSNINWIVATGNRKAKQDLLARLKAEKATLDPKDVQLRVMVNSGIERLEESLVPGKGRA